MANQSTVSNPYKRHDALVRKMFDEGLSSVETKELRNLRKQLDREIEREYPFDCHRWLQEMDEMLVDLKAGLEKLKKRHKEIHNE